MNYKNIIFDLGGVILNIDYQKTIDAFRTIGITDFDARYSQAKQTPLFDDLEIGRISPEQFRKELKIILNANVSDDVIDEAWNALLLDFPKERLDLLEQLHKQYRTFLLSNTNEIHYQAYTRQLQDKFGLNDLSKFFEHTYYSHQIGLRKPNADVFYKVLNDHHLKANETLFIDDSIQHIQSAQKLGIQTHWLTDGETIMNLFS